MTWIPWTLCIKLILIPEPPLASHCLPQDKTHSFLLWWPFGGIIKAKGLRERERNAKGTDKNLERKCESIIFQRRPSTPFFGPSGNPHPVSWPQEIHPWLDPGTCDPQKCFWCSMHPRHVAEGSRGEWLCPQASGRRKRGARVVNAEG